MDANYDEVEAQFVLLIQDLENLSTEAGSVNEYQALIKLLTKHRRDVSQLMQLMSKSDDSRDQVRALKKMVSIIDEHWIIASKALSQIPKSV